MSLSLLNQTILRQKIASGFVTKGSSIAWLEEDDNWTIVVDAIRELANVPVDTTGFEEYNAGTTYENGDFVAYNGNIYQYINNVPSAGVTPGTDVLYWEISSQGQFAHERNKDTYLDLGGTYEVSAEDIYNLLNAGPLPYLTQGTNTLTEDLELDGGGTFNVIIQNGNLDLSGNDIVGLSKIYDSLDDLTIDLDNRSLEGDWSIMTAGVSGIGFLIENSSNQSLYEISNDGKHVLSSRLTIGDFGTVAEPNVSVFNIVTSESNRFQRFKNTSGTGHIFDIASNPTYKGLGFYNDNNAAYQLNIMQDGRNVYGGLPPLDDDAIHSFYGAAWFQDEIEILDSFIMTDTTDSQRIRVTITDRAFVFTEI